MNLDSIPIARILKDLGVIVVVLAIAGGSGPDALAGTLMIVAVVYGFILYGRYQQSQQDNWMDSQTRGRRMQSTSDAAAAVQRAARPNDRGIWWGKLRISEYEATSHFCVVGAVGSGKTLTLRMLMQDQLPCIQPGSDARAMIYDAKQDMLPILYSLNLQCPIVVLNPFDKRAAAWHLASDIETPAAARQLAMTLIPEKEESQPFFSNAVRELLTAVVTVFTQTMPGRWTLRDVLLVMKSKERLRQVLGSHPLTADKVGDFLDCGEVTLGSIMATAATKLGPYEAIAACWENAERKISIKNWLRSESILVLGNDERIRSSLDTVNQLFVSIAAQHTLTMSESNSRRSWFFFDEFREAGKLTGLHSLIVRGRSKGCCVVLGFQDIQGLQEVYGEHVANEIVGQCGNKAFLRMESPATAKWASECVSDVEFIEVNVSQTNSPQGGSSTQTQQKVVRPQVMAAEFLSMPVTNQFNGLHGVYLVRSVGCYQEVYSPQELDMHLARIDGRYLAFDPAPVDWQFLSPWSSSDYEKLGIGSVQHDVGRVDEAHKPEKKARPGLDAIERMVR